MPQPLASRATATETLVLFCGANNTGDKFHHKLEPADERTKLSHGRQHRSISTHYFAALRCIVRSRVECELAIAFSALSVAPVCNPEHDTYLRDCVICAGTLPKLPSSARNPNKLTKTLSSSCSKLRTVRWRCCRCYC